MYLYNMYRLYRSLLVNHVKHNHLGPEIYYNGKLIRPEKMQELDVGDFKVCLLHSKFE